MLKCCLQLVTICSNLVLIHTHWMISNPVPYHENLNKTTVVYLRIPVIRCPASAVPHFFAASSSCLNASHVIWCMCKRMHMVKRSHWHPQCRGSRTLVLTPIIWPGVWLCYRPVSYTLSGCCLTTCKFGFGKESKKKEFSCTCSTGVESF